jgi:hypothetical protein
MNNTAVSAKTAVMSSDLLLEFMRTSTGSAIKPALINTNGVGLKQSRERTNETK